MRTDHQTAAWKRAHTLLTELLHSPLARPPQPWRCLFIWESRDDVGIEIVGGANWLTDEIGEWFRKRGWLAVSLREDVRIAPFVQALPPDLCYHVTPAYNEEGIRERGLLRGVDAGRSTTGRPDAARRIHVSFKPEDAVKWAGDQLLGKHQLGQEWVMFEISSAGIVGKVFRDPFSQTGYILEARAVAKEFLQVRERIKGKPVLDVRR